MIKGAVPGSMLSCLRGAGSLVELGAVATQNIQPRPRAHTDNPIWSIRLYWLLAEGYHNQHTQTPASDRVAMIVSFRHSDIMPRRSVA